MGVPKAVESVLCSPGLPLDGETSALMQRRFNYDFSTVRDSFGRPYAGAVRDFIAKFIEPRSSDDALSDLADRQLIVDFLAGNWFKKLNAGQQEVFRRMLEEFGLRKWSNQLTEDLQKKVGISKASQMSQQGSTGFSPGGLQLSNPGGNP